MGGGGGEFSSCMNFVLFKCSMQEIIFSQNLLTFFKLGRSLLDFFFLGSVVIVHEFFFAQFSLT